MKFMIQLWLITDPTDEDAEPEPHALIVTQDLETGNDGLCTTRYGYTPWHLRYDTQPGELASFHRMHVQSLVDAVPDTYIGYGAEIVDILIAPDERYIT